MFNEETLRGKWKEIKGEIQTKWGELTDDELEKSKGNMSSISGIIQQRYGAKKEEVEGALERIFSRFSNKSGEVKNRMQDDKFQDKDQSLGI